MKHNLWLSNPETSASLGAMPTQQSSKSQVWSARIRPTFKPSAIGLGALAIDLQISTSDLLQYINQCSIKPLTKVAIPREISTFPGQSFDEQWARVDLENIEALSNNPFACLREDPKFKRAELPDGSSVNHYNWQYRKLDQLFISQADITRVQTKFKVRKTKKREEPNTRMSPMQTQLLDLANSYLRDIGSEKRKPLMFSGGKRDGMYIISALATRLKKHFKEKDLPSTGRIENLLGPVENQLYRR